MEKENMTYEKIFNLGVEAGIKKIEEKIECQCERGKPILANGNLYWLKDARQNLIDIMDDIDAEYGVQKRKKYIVPIHRGEGEKYVERMAVIIEANTPDEAMTQAVFSFGYGGWIVDKDYKHYKQLE